MFIYINKIASFMRELEESFRNAILRKERGDTLYKETNTIIYACFFVLEKNSDKGGGGIRRKLFGETQGKCLRLLRELREFIYRKEVEWGANEVEKAWRVVSRYNLLTLGHNLEKLSKKTKDMPSVQVSICSIAELMPFGNKPKNYWHKVGTN